MTFKSNTRAYCLSCACVFDTDNNNPRDKVLIIKCKSHNNLAETFAYNKIWQQKNEKDRTTERKKPMFDKR